MEFLNNIQDNSFLITSNEIKEKILDYIEENNLLLNVKFISFNDLKEGDIIYFVDHSNLTIVNYKIVEYSKKKSDSYYNLNSFEIEFKLETFDNCDFFKLYNGNIFIHHEFGRRKGFYVTDNRIAESLIDILKARNSYQWSQFTSLFGNPMARYADKDIKLG